MRMGNNGVMRRRDAGLARAISGILSQYPGARISLGKVIRPRGRPGAVGSWRPCRSRIDRDGAVTVVIVGDSCLVRARVFVVSPGDDR